MILRLSFPHTWFSLTLPERLLFSNLKVSGLGPSNQVPLPCTASPMGQGRLPSLSSLAPQPQ